MTHASSPVAAAGFTLFGIASDATARQWLGLPQIVNDEPSVVDALRRRLDIVNADRALPEEVLDAVRERLRVAANEVLSPSLEPAAVLAPPSGVGRPAAVGKHLDSAPPATVGAMQAESQLRLAIRQILGAEGGFTPLASMKLAQLAKINGLSVDEVMVIAKDGRMLDPKPVAPATPKAMPSGSKPPTLQAGQPRTTEPRSRERNRTPQDSGSHDDRVSIASGIPSESGDFAQSEAEAERWNRRLKIAVVGGGLGLAALAVAMIVVGLLFANPATPKATADGSATSAPTNGGSATAVPAGVNSFPVPPTAGTTPPPPGAGNLVTAAPVGEVAPIVPSTPAQTTNPSENNITFADVVRSAQAAAATASEDPALGVVQFAKIFPNMASGWVETDRADRIAVTDALTNLAFAVKDDARASEALMDVVASEGSAWTATSLPTAAEIPRLIFAAGITARLAKETDFPAPFVSRIQRELARAVGAGFSMQEPPFDVGAMAAIARLMPLLVPAADSSLDQTEVPRQRWVAWVRSVTALKGKDTPERERVILRALEMLLTQAPDPATNRGVYESIGALASEVSWRKGSPARESLLAWLRAPAVASSDLHALTAALATGTPAPGVDISMILAVNAGDSERAQLRERFATVWGIAAPSARADIFLAWQKIAEPMIEGSPDAQPSIVLSQAVVFARLNGAASLVWSGESGAVPADLTSLDAVSKLHLAALNPNVGKSVFNSVSNQPWALQYLRLESNIPQREGLLAAFQGEPDALAAAVLVREACRGTPQSIQAAAQILVRQHGSSIEILTALLDLAPLMPATRACGDLVRDATLTQLPSPKNASWRVAVRRALVERLLERFAESGEFAAVDAFAASLAGALALDPAARAIEVAPVALTASDTVEPEPAPQPQELDAEAPPDPLQTPALLPGDPDALETLAMRRHAALEREARTTIPSGAEPVTLAESRAALEARLHIASGPVQKFVARQFASAELLAFVIVAERPQRADLARGIIESMHDSRRAARHVFEQVYTAERAITRLWQLRLSENAL